LTINREFAALRRAAAAINIRVSKNDRRRPARGATPDPFTAMIIRVLGCSGAIAAGCRTTSFLLDDSVLIDAGTGVGDLTLSELARIDHILISHSHLDHVLSIGLLADSVMRRRLAKKRGPVTVHALPETLKALRDHIFNGVIWPDFTRLPSVDTPTLQFKPFAAGDTLELAGHCIEVLSAAHTVPAVGFAVEGGDAGWWVYTGDTGPNPALWERLASMKVAHLVIETAFADEERQLAQISRHLCPTTLRDELVHLGGSVDVHITHIKPGELDAVMAQIARLGCAHRIHALAAGQEIRSGQDARSDAFRTS
jgi:ribonuclease BN (tRNA processing enzyme)